MRRMIMVFWALVLLGACDDKRAVRYEEAVVRDPPRVFQVGERIKLLGWFWARLAISADGNAVGETCGVEAGGYLMVVALMGEEEALVRYIAPVDAVQGGTSCPDGWAVVVTGRDIQSMEEQARERAVFAARVRQAYVKAYDIEPSSNVEEER